MLLSLVAVLRNEDELWMKFTTPVQFGMNEHL